MILEEFLFFLSIAALGALAGFTALKSKNSSPATTLYTWILYGSAWGMITFLVLIVLGIEPLGGLF